jgi:hypothetical protein
LINKGKEKSERGKKENECETIRGRRKNKQRRGKEEIDNTVIKR